MWRRWVLLGVFFGSFFLGTLSDARTNYDTAFSLYRQAQRFLDEGRPDLVLAEILDTSQRELTFFGVNRVRLMLAGHFVKSREFQRARYLIRQYLLAEWDPVLAPEALLLLIEMSILSKDINGALDDYAVLHRRYPERDLDGALFKRIQAISLDEISIDNTLKTAPEQLDRFRGLLEISAYDQILQEITWVKERFEDSIESAEFIYFEALARYYLGDLRKANSLFSSTLGIRPDNRSPWPDAFYFYGKSLDKAHRPLEAMQQYKKSLSFPKRYSAYRPQAYYEMATYFAQSSQSLSFEKTYEGFRKEYGDTLPFDRFVWEQVGDLTPEFEKRLHLFYGTLYRENGYRKGDAVAWGKVHYPLSFYSYQILKGYLGSEVSQPTGQDALVYRYIKRLFDRGYANFAVDEAKYHLWKGTPHRLGYLYGMAMINRYEGRHAENVRALSDYLGEPFTVYGQMERPLFTFLFPRLYWAWIRDTSSRVEIDPYWVVAVIRSVSDFDIRKVDGDKYGLLQLSLGRAKDVSFRLGYEWKGEEALLSPNWNVSLGAYYLAWLKKEFKGNMVAVLAAYYEDPVDVKGWFKEGDLEKGVEASLEKVKYEPLRERIRRTLDYYLIYKLAYKL